MSMLLYLWQYSIEENNTTIATKLIENVRRFSSAINEEKQIVSQYVHDWTPMDTFVITEIRDHYEKSVVKWYYLINLFVNLFITIISISIYYLLMELFICNIYWYQLYLSSYLFKEDLTTCDNYLFKEIIISYWQVTIVNIRDY